MTGKTTDGIVIDRDFGVPRAAVFAAWTTSVHFARWFGGPDVEVPLESLDYTPEAGGTWTAHMVLPNGGTIDWAGDFVEVVPDERFVFTVTDRPDDPIRARIIVELSPIDGGTRMRFSQETPGFTAEQQDGVLAGWQGFFDELERTVTV